MGVDAGSVYSSVRIKLDSLDNDLKGVYSRLGQLETNIKKVPEVTKPAQAGFKDMFKAVVTGQAVIGLAQKGFSLFTGAIKDSIKVSIDSQEIISKYDAVFGGMGEASEEAAKRFSDAFDLAGATAKEMLSNTGNLLQGLGATREESLSLSEQVNIMASDLASFTNYSGGAKGASEALTKALLGEREQMKSLGIAILESDVQGKLAEKGQKNLEGTALKLAKAHATLELITEQSKNAIGDYARTADSASNTQKRAAENTKQLQIVIGTALNPAVTVMADIWARVSGAMADVIGKQNELKDARKADKDGNITLSQRILLLQNERKGLEQLLVGEKNLAEQYGIAETQEGKRLKESIDGINAEIAGMERFKKSYEAGQLSKAQADEKAAKAAADRAAREEETNARYSASREMVISVLESEQKEYDKIEAQIQKLQSTPWAKGELETERLAAIEALREKQRELVDDERQANDESRQSARSRLSLNQNIIDGVYALGKAEDDRNEVARRAAIKEIEDSTLVREQKDALIEKTNEYYDALENDAAAKAFAKNTISAVQSVSTVLSAASALQTALTNQRLSELDAEMQAALEAAGVAQLSAVETAQIELETATESGDKQNIEKARQALEKAKIEEEYAKRKARVEYNGAMSAWKINIALATASAAQAILNGLLMQPFIPVGLASAAIATTAGGLQLAAVKAAKPVLSYATGGIVEASNSGTLVNVAENGSGEVLFNTGSTGQAFVNQMAAAIANSIGASNSRQNVFQIGTVIGSASGLRELNRLLAKYSSVEEKRTMK